MPPFIPFGLFDFSNTRLKTSQIRAVNMPSCKIQIELMEKLNKNQEFNKKIIQNLYLNTFLDSPNLRYILSKFIVGYHYHNSNLYNEKIKK